MGWVWLTALNVLRTGQCAATPMHLGVAMQHASRAKDRESRGFLLNLLSRPETWKAERQDLREGGHKSPTLLAKVQPQGKRGEGRKGEGRRETAQENEMGRTQFQRT